VELKNLVRSAVEKFPTSIKNYASIFRNVIPDTLIIWCSCINFLTTVTFIKELNREKLGQDSQDRAAGIGYSQDRKERRGQQEFNSKDRTAGTRQPGGDNLGRTFKIEQSGQDIWDRRTGTGQLRQVCLDKSA
jgi:hypothetical protein